MVELLVTGNLTVKLSTRLAARGVIWLQELVVLTGG